MAHGYKRSPPLGKASGMPYSVLLGRRSTNRLGCARSSREARVMHAPPQEGHRGPRRPQRGRITSKLKRVWVATGTSYPRWSMIHDGNQTPEDTGHAPAMKRVLATVAVVAAALLLLLLVWYGVSVVLLVFASVLLAIFFANVSHFVSRHTALAYGWSLALVTL